MAGEEPAGEESGEGKEVDALGTAEEGGGGEEGEGGGGETGGGKFDVAEEGLSGEEERGGEGEAEGGEVEMVGDEVEDEEGEEDIQDLGEGPGGVKERAMDGDQTVEPEVGEEGKSLPGGEGEEEKDQCGSLGREFEVSQETGG